MIVMPVAASPASIARCDRRRAAPARQQRRVDVEAAVPRPVEDRRAAVSGRTRPPPARRAGPRAAPRVGVGACSDGGLRARGSPCAAARRLTGDGVKASPRPGWAIGLRQDERYRDSRLPTRRVERACREIRRAGEAYAHRRAASAREPLLLAELGREARALERRQVVDEHLAYADGPFRAGCTRRAGRRRRVRTVRRARPARGRGRGRPGSTLS